MDEELLKILERIASALEKISNCLYKEPLLERMSNKEAIDISKESITEGEVKIEGEEIKEKLQRQYLIIDYLSSRKVTIKHISPEDKADEILDKLSISMGNRYNLIKSFYERIKNKMNSGGTIRMDLKDKTQEEISGICQLSKNFHEIAFLEEYTYLKAPKYLLFAKPNRIPEALNFFSGKWLERFIRTQVISLIRQVNPNIKFSYISNPQVKLPNGDDFELDFLFEIEGEIYWFEVKTGDYQRYVKKYSTVSKILNLDESHSFMILTDIAVPGAKALKSLFNMNIIKIENFSEEFLKMIIRYSDSNIPNDNNVQNTSPNTA